jgi:hypothetical protein
MQMGLRHTRTANQSDHLPCADLLPVLDRAFENAGICDDVGVEQNVMANKFAVNPSAHIASINGRVPAQNARRYT